MFPICHNNYMAVIASAIAFLFSSCHYSLEEKHNLCFIGDSITHLWDIDYFFPEYSPANYGVNGAKIDDVFEWDLSECEGIPSVILIGTNNLNAVVKSEKSKATFIEQYIQKYMKILDQTKSNKYIIISILPRDRLYKENESMNSYIKVLNDSLKSSLQKQDFESKFVDAYPHFLRDSAIIKDYYSDGLHLSEEGYSLLSTLVRDAL